MSEQAAIALCPQCTLLSHSPIVAATMRKLGAECRGGTLARRRDSIARAVTWRRFWSQYRQPDLSAPPPPLLLMLLRWRPWRDICPSPEHLGGARFTNDFKTIYDKNRLTKSYDHHPLAILRQWQQLQTVITNLRLLLFSNKSQQEIAYVYSDVISYHNAEVSLCNWVTVYESRPCFVVMVREGLSHKVSVWWGLGKYGSELVLGFGFTVRVKLRL